MERLASLQRFEDAALVRDRWESLSRAIHRSRVWRSLQEARSIEVAGSGDTTLQISHGRMDIAWTTDSARPLTLATLSEPSVHPPSMAALDEAMLLWNWLSKSGTRVASVDDALAMPATRIPTLINDQSTRLQRVDNRLS
jgi:DNA polymerase-3 subunit epsilon